MFRFAQHDMSSMNWERLGTELEMVPFIGVIRG
jgi:hypothetical protein